MNDEVMEMLSNKVRKGEPVSLLDAIAVINYQATLRAERRVNRSKNPWGRFLNWIGYDS